MLKAITLRNFKSFGAEQRVPLQPLTVLVGPNNSGKSAFCSVGRLVSNAVRVGDPLAAVLAEGGAREIVHRPQVGGGECSLSWETSEGWAPGAEVAGTYAIQLASDGRDVLIQMDEQLQVNGQSAFSESRPGTVQLIDGTTARNHTAYDPFAGLIAVTDSVSEELRMHRAVLTPLVKSQLVRLSLPALRQDGQVIENAILGLDGAEMAAVLAVWRGSELDKAARLDAFVKRCIPEIKNVLVRNSPQPGKQRLLVRQEDGEDFEAARVSDGVLCCIALAMHAINAEPGSVLFVEEPEHAVHPQRVAELVDLFREIVQSGVQVVLATHSPPLLDEFRDDPEAILLFRRTETGTRVSPLSEHADLCESLAGSHVDPGVLLVNGFLSNSLEAPKV